MDLGLAGKVAVVTGAGSGIGAAIAVSLAAEGCVVHLGDIRLEAAQRVARAMTGRQAYTHQVDIADPSAVDVFVAAVLDRSSRVDVLVNSAGLLGTGGFADSSVEEWQNLLDVNLSGVLYMSRSVLPAMRTQGGGRVVTIASVSAMRGGGAIGNTLYGTTKAGVVALTKGLARELGPLGIAVNAIAPSVVDTPMTAGSLDEDVRQRILARTPLGRLCRPEEVAALAAFLASDVCAFCTGETVVLDGGFLNA
jgi:NAD(P)-dependent dehydrogenase (short-subunit alcohol dehydrogenase family)